MHQTSFQSSAWYNAIPLTERITFLRTQQSKTPKVEVNVALAQRRMQRWKSQFPFTNDSYFDQRLTMDAITEKEFIYLLGEPTDVMKTRFSAIPDWLTDLAQAFFHPTYSNATIILPPQKLGEQKESGFLYAIEPLISQGLDRLHEGIQKLIQTYQNLPFDPTTIKALLFANLPGELLWMLNRTMILELNVARLQGLLVGDLPEDRFQSFLERLHQHEVVIFILKEYPVLARQLVISINQWVSYSLEFLQHLCTDWSDIRTTFSPEAETGVMVQIDGGVSDTHRGGRSVLIAKFSSGFQIVYKPKSLAVDVHFQQLLEWLNQRGNYPPFRTIKIINRGTYGWVEFVTAKGCNDPECLQNFYKRQGGYLALLYALEATDFHLENLIAVGEHPVLVDLESLFHPRIESIDIKKSEQLAINTIDNSVLRVGLLPQRFWANAESEGAEISGLGGKEGQLTPHRVSYSEEIGTDEMRVARKQMPMSGSQNRPTLNDAEVNVLDYTEAIITGFTNIYQLILQYRDELLSENSPLARFAEDEVRFLLRQTRSYGLLLHESFHPNLLRNALDRDRFFDRLWVGIEKQPYLTKVIAAERDDLWQGDIPMFTTRPNSRAIWSSFNKKIADFFDETGMTLVQRRIQQLSNADLKQQIWFVRASLSTLAMAEEQAKWPTYHLNKPQNSASYEQLVAAAQVVGDRLEKLALNGEKDISWIGLTLIEKHWTLTALEIDLYEGLPGVILFLAYLGALTEQKRYTALAKAALVTMQRQVESSREYIKSLGGFSGWGGVIYTLTQLGVLWNEPELLTEAESLVEQFPNLISKDEQLDILSGTAGGLASLISLYRCRPSQRTLAAAIQCGERLITTAKPMEYGVGWTTQIAELKPLTGFSHGVAGIAWVLLELASLTGEQRFKTTALAAIEYERSLFRPEVGNWPDLRDFSSSILADKDDNQPTCMTAWCHGAPGIGLGRLRSLPHLDDAKIRTEIDTALKTTLEHGFGSNHSLCHGDLGNLELLLQASQTFDDPQWKTQVDRFAAIILESIDKYGWLCGVPLGVETPGLMTGLAGIGYGLLRLAAPDRVPSVLVLEPPKLNRAVQKSTDCAIAI
ncbi:Lanthionine synthetase C-like protein [Coleofasciculus chthonoplastes PCC 7420]|uniref:Lanthionine synthetase C-like protein n=1 Tax=Coleofasciculus chthonoplastes PCC 7420 TaxID=118168 RepID=B4VPV4_9CYAN|nr:type 2 lanthipeptide synthetase LanM family protein [Coleofasciculus chthonoplastes]EDX76063.1 Lanthionine synthetase C-like protein [Coleofasciculus chthonoplastes PCC 7420]